MNPTEDEKKTELHRRFFKAIDGVRSDHDLDSHDGYKSFKWLVDQTLKQHEYIAPASAPEIFKRDFVKVVAWNVERGIALPHILSTLKNHRQLKDADIYLITEVDAGMARSGNFHVAREMAKALNLHTIFGPAYMNLGKGNGAEERIAKGENTLALQGHAILSRYPMENIELVALPKTKNYMGGRRERQVGCEQAVVATVQTPHGPVHAASLHLSLRSSRQQRVLQMKSVLDALSKRKGPALIGGDWNTTTYNAHKAWPTIFGFWHRVAMGVVNVIQNHYPYPERYFEKDLFNMLQAQGFQTNDFNFPGGCTVHYNVAEPQNFQNLGDWIPDWCFKFILWSLRHTEGRCSFKLDWIAGRDLKGTNASIVYDLPRGFQRISDHDPILVDVIPA